jgi:co-chaperonin GroES (HSP10)
MICQFEKKTEAICPFVINDKIKFPVQPLGSGLFVWPDPLPEKIGSFFIPEDYQENYRRSTGIVLAIGPGYFSKKKGRFISTEAKLGDRVVFDRQILCHIPIQTPEGKEEIVWKMVEADIMGIVNCKDCEKYRKCHS